MREDSDEELVRRFQRGSEQAFSVFVARHRDGVYRFGMLWLRDVNDVDDLVQEVFLRSHRGLMKFRFRSKTKTWLYRTAKNVSLEINRRVERHAAGRARWVNGTSDAQLPLSSASSEDVADARERDTTIATVRSMLEALPQRQREVVALRVFQELSVDDAAVVMGCRPGTVKALLHQALSRLREGALVHELELRG